MPDEMKSLWRELMAVFDAAEQKHLAAYNAALGMEDWAEAQRVSGDALRSIAQIRAWRGKLDAPAHQANADSPPTTMRLLGRAYPVRGWQDVYVNTCVAMVWHKPYVMAALDKDAALNTDRGTRFSYAENAITGAGKRLSNGLWMETHLNADGCLHASRQIIEKCGYAPDALIVE